MTNSPPNTEAYAVERALEDFELIEAAARNAVMGLMTNAAGSLLIVDGTQYSPSWRALSGGYAVYALDQDHDAEGRLVGAYEEQLDELTDQWSGRHEETLAWEDGCLFVFGADFDFDQLT